MVVASLYWIVSFSQQGVGFRQGFISSIRRPHPPHRRTGRLPRAAQGDIRMLPVTQITVEE